MERTDYKKIIIIGTEEYTQDQQIYFNNMLKHVDDEILVISLSEEHNAKNCINIKSAPDFFMLYRLLDLIMPETKQHNIPISVYISKCDKHTISNVINLKLLGIENVYLSKCTPIMLNPTLTSTLSDIYGIKPTAE